MAKKVSPVLGFSGFLRDFVWCLKHFFGMLRFYWRIDMGIALDTRPDDSDDVTLF